MGNDLIFVGAVVAAVICGVQTVRTRAGDWTAIAGLIGFGAIALARFVH